MQKPACRSNRQFFERVEDIVTLLSLFTYHRYTDTDPDPGIRSVSLDYDCCFFTDSKGAHKEYVFSFLLLISLGILIEEGRAASKSPQ
jgi:hypothetical protein